MEVEMEANRLVFIQYLDDLRKSKIYLTATANAAAATTTIAAGNGAGDVVGEGGVLGSSRGVPKLSLPQASTSKPHPTTTADSGGILNITPGIIGGGGSSSSTTMTSSSKEVGTDFIIARHVLEFGHVVSGTIKTMKFKVTNPATAGGGTLSWTFNKAPLVSNGFMIRPEKVVRLPEGQSAEFEVVLNAKVGISLGQKEVELPLEGKKSL